jgi:hypothetical protein
VSILVHRLLPSAVRPLKNKRRSLRQAGLEVRELVAQDILLRLVRADLLLELDDEAFEFDIVLLELSQILTFALASPARALCACHENQFFSFLFDSVFLGCAARRREAGERRRQVHVSELFVNAFYDANSRIYRSAGETIERSLTSLIETILSAESAVMASPTIALVCSIGVRMGTNEISAIQLCLPQNCVAVVASCANNLLRLALRLE